MARANFPFLVALVAVLCGRAMGEGTSVTPAFLSLGTTYQGSVMECSVWLAIDGDDPNATASVETPVFVRPKKTTVQMQKFDKMPPRTSCYAIFSVDTKETGKFKGNCVVHLGDTTVEVPISVEVIAREPGQQRVLVVQTPFHAQSSDGSATQAWVEMCQRTKLDIDNVDVDHDAENALPAGDLDRYASILLCDNGLWKLSAKDVERLQKYAEAGGRIILTANYFFRQTVQKANLLLEPNGLQMQDVEKDLDKVQGEGLAKDPLLEGVSLLSFHRASPIKITDKNKAKILVDAPPFPEHGFVAKTKAGKGEIIALGQSMPWNWVQANGGKEADNAMLIINLLSRSRRE